jgi:hypothetical protein
MTDLVVVSEVDLTAIKEEKDQILEIMAPRTKLEVIVELVKTHTTTYVRIEDNDAIHNNNIMAGMIDLPAPSDVDRRYLICSEYEETTAAAFNAIRAEGIQVLKLEGTAERQRTILNSFRSGETAVLMIDRSHVAGLDLAYVTDLIFMQTMDNTELAKQVIGRIQRYGRTTQGTVHLLNYTLASN